MIRRVSKIQQATSFVRKLSLVPAGVPRAFRYARNACMHTSKSEWNRDSGSRGSRCCHDGKSKPRADDVSPRRYTPGIEICRARSGKGRGGGESKHVSIAREQAGAEWGKVECVRARVERGCQCQLVRRGDLWCRRRVNRHLYNSERVRFFFFHLAFCHSSKTVLRCLSFVSP